MTGITTRNTILARKRLQLLKEVLPGLTHVAVFLDSFGQAELEELKPASATLGIRLHLIDLRPNYDLSRAFREARAQKVGAVMVLGSALLYVRSGQLGSMALENKLPLIGQWRALVDSGGLMSYSTDVTDGFYRSAYLVDRLLKGARAADVPLEQTANIKLVVNMKSAQALGIAVPQSILLRADQLVSYVQGVNQNGGPKSTPLGAASKEQVTSGCTFASPVRCTPASRRPAYPRTSSALRDTPDLVSTSQPGSDPAPSGNQADPASSRRPRRPCRSRIALKH